VPVSPVLLSLIALVLLRVSLAPPVQAALVLSHAAPAPLRQVFLVPPVPVSPALLVRAALVPLVQVFPVL
jgi:hypothetical protein